MLGKITDPNCTSEYDGDVELPELGKWYSWAEVMDLKVFNVALKGFGFVYAYYDMVNKKYYVGVCKQSVRARARQHYKRTSNSSYVDKAIKDVGCNRILVCIVKVCKTKNLAYFENYFIDILNTIHPNGYNAMKSGYKSIDSNIQEVLSRELPQERLLELLDIGHTYCTIANTVLPIKISPNTLSAYGRSLGIVIKVRAGISPNKIAELSNKGYSNREIAQTLGIKSKNTIADIKRKYNISSIRKPSECRPVLEIDLTSGVIIAQYASVKEASNAHKIQPCSLTNRIRRKTITKDAYLIYKDEYLDQQWSSTQVAEGA